MKAPSGAGGLDRFGKAEIRMSGGRKGSPLRAPPRGGSAPPGPFALERRAGWMRTLPHIDNPC
jgi:hypothetical protein